MIFQMMPSHTSQHENNFVSWEKIFSLIFSIFSNTDKVSQKTINFEIL